jgi:hypothetical protein
MTSEGITNHIFSHVGNALKGIAQDPGAKLYPSEVVTPGSLFALKGGHFRAFFGCMKRDAAYLFGGLPHRTSLGRQVPVQQAPTDWLMEQPSVLKGVDSYPIELIFPIRQGRSSQQFGGKHKDKRLWSVGVKLWWRLNTFGQVGGWIGDPMNVPDNHFLDFFEQYDQQAILGAAGLPDNVKLCKTGTWNDTVRLDTSLSMLTVLGKASIAWNTTSPPAWPTPLPCSMPV